jgi:surface polysaccharide O-acyltransferase-like enzyme
LALKDFFNKHPMFNAETIKQKITKISNASFGIFLSHALVLDILASGKLGFSIYELVANPLLALPLTIALVFSISLVIILTLQKTNKTWFG